MPKLIIDNKEIDVPQGTKVIEAAEMLGIMIPRFCYHPALGSAGACRVCAVKVVKGPVKGLQMSCMIEAQEGMIISTTDKEAVEFRKYVIEWLMLNHPHDCPVCDEGGQCLLQDMTVSGGHGLRRFQGKKRTHNDQYLGPLIQHEMNRCIQCYRCSRYYKEYTGYSDLGVMGIGSRIYFGRQKSGILESPFAGNLTDLCPTGVYTDKPSRFKGRRWDFERSPSICLNCSLGCNTVVCIRYRELVRQEARFNEKINGYFICDRGRYGFYYASADNRPRDPIVDGNKVSYQQAVDTAVQRLSVLKSKVACIGSERSSFETQSIINSLCQTKKWNPPVYWTDENTAQTIKTASKIEQKLTVSLSKIEKSDFILAIGADPVNEAPMLALAMRQAWKNRAEIAVIDPRPVCLNLEFDHIKIKPSKIEAFVGQLIKQVIDKNIKDSMTHDDLKFYNSIWCKEFEKDELILLTAQKVKKSQNPVIICGTDIASNTLPRLSADFAHFLKLLNKKSGIFFLMPGPNSFGAAVLSNNNSFENILSDIENNKVNALIVIENNLFRNFPDQTRLKNCLKKLDLLIVLDYLNSQLIKLADIFLPTQTMYESGGTFINHQGCIQSVPKAFKGGTPVSQISNQDHPPRTFRNDIPGSQAKPAWEILGSLSSEQLAVDSEQLALSSEQLAVNSEQLKINELTSLELILTEQTFGTEELSSLSECLREIEQKPCIFINHQDALSMGFENGDFIELESKWGVVRVQVKVFENMAQGVMILPRHRDIPWQYMKTNKIDKNKIRKLNKSYKS